MTTTVLGTGPVPARIMIVGERPGREELRAGRPFVGPAGQELQAHLFDRVLWKYGLSRRDCYITNLVKTFSTKPPSVEEIARDEKYLVKELARVRPTCIITVGAHAMRWFLGEDRTLEACHGLLHASVRRPAFLTVIPIHHSSYALQRKEAQPIFAWDCEQVGRILHPCRAPHLRLRLLVSEPKKIPCPRLSTSLASITRYDDLAADTEGTPANPALLQLTADGSMVYLCSLPPPRPIRAALTDFVTTRARLTFHYAKHDLQVLARVGLTPHEFDCTYLMAYELGPGTARALKTLAYRLHRWDLPVLGDYLAPLDDQRVRRRLEHKASSNHLPKRAASSIRRMLAVTGKDPARPAAGLRKRWARSVFADLVTLPPEPEYEDLPEVERTAYAARDAALEYHVKRDLWPRLMEEGLVEVYKIDKSVLPMEARMESIGMEVDVTRLHALARELRREYRRLCRAIRDLVGQDLNPCSPPQVSHLLFNTLHLEPTRLSKSGKHYTTEDKFLEARRGKHPVIPLIIEARLIAKMRGTYAEKLPDLIGEDGRYHPDFGLTDTGRYTEPVVLLIPKHSRWGTPIRRAFVAGEGRLLYSCDLSQIEMRTAAHLSQDETLLDIFRTGKDAHAETAYQLFGVPPERQNDSLHRLPAKTANFSILMGTTARGYMEQLHEQAGMLNIPALLDYDEDDCQRMLEAWYDDHPGWSQWRQARIQEARIRGYVRDLVGRKIHCQGVWSSKPSIRAHFERLAHAGPVQSSAVSITKRWMAHLWEALQRWHEKTYLEPWLQIHDDVILNGNRSLRTSIHTMMQATIPQVLCVPVRAEFASGENWGDLEKHVTG